MQHSEINKKWIYVLSLKLWILLLELYILAQPCFGQIFLNSKFVLVNLELNIFEYK